MTQNKKFLTGCAVLLILAAVGILIGFHVGVWELSAAAQGIWGLAAILPAVLWVFFGGINALNVLLYLLGMDFILWKAGFYGTAPAWIFAAAAAVVLAVPYILLKMRKNKAEQPTKEAALESESTQTER